MGEVRVKPKPYFYDRQFHRYVKQIMATFSGFQVATGRQRDGKPRFIGVPVIFGGRDRLTAYLQGGESQNSVMSLPVISIRPTSLKQDAERRRAPYHSRLQAYVDRNVTPDAEGDATTEGEPRQMLVEMWMPVPYLFEFEVTVLSSNMDQGMQIVEQIGVLYNPELDMKISDSPLDWTFLSRINFQGNIDIGREARDLGAGNGPETPHTFSMRFDTMMHFNAPVMVHRDPDLVQEIHVEIKEMIEKAIRESVDWDELETIDTLIVRTEDIPDET